MLDTNRQRSFALASLVALLFCNMAASSVDAAVWHGTKSLRTKLSRPVTLLWQGQQLRKSLDTIQAAYDVEVWLDRRLDPQQTFDLEITDQPLREVFEEIAQQCEAGYQVYGDLIYVGPKKSADQFATLMVLARERLNNCPARIQRRWLGRYELGWESPAEPLFLLGELVAQCQAELTTNNLVPHDLWRAGKAPDLRAYELATLWLLSFDRQAKIDPRSGSLVVERLRSPIGVKRTYVSSEKLLTFLETNPQSATKRTSDQISVFGTVEYHHALAEHLHGKSPSQNSPVGTKESSPREPKQLVFTLKIENQPVGAVTDQLAKQLKLTVTWAAETKVLRNQLVSCQVRNASLEELLAAVLAPAKLKAIQEEDGYRITKQ